MKVEIIKGPGSCKEGITINLDKYLTLIYGNNGSGKTIISDAFYLEQRKKRGNPDAKTTSLVGIGEYQTNLGELGCQYYAYNTSFIKRNFEQEDDVSGIVTLGEDSINSRTKINEADRVKEELLHKKGEKNDSLDAKANALETAKKAIKDKVWEVKPKYERGKLRFCMRREEGKAGLHAKDSFFEEFERHSPDYQNGKALDDLEKDAERLVGDEVTEEKEMKIPQFDAAAVSEIEKSPLFAESIVGTSNSYLAALISKHDNSSWVRKGLEYTEPSEGPCPFCQQNIKPELLQTIENYFDEAYKRNIKELKAIKEKYKVLLLDASYEDRLTELESNDLCTSDCKENFQKLRSALDDNYRKIEVKIKEPNRKVALTDTTKLIAKLTEVLRRPMTKLPIITSEEETKKQLKKK